MERDYRLEMQARVMADPVDRQAVKRGEEFQRKLFERATPSAPPAATTDDGEETNG